MSVLGFPPSRPEAAATSSRSSSYDARSGRTVPDRPGAGDGGFTSEPGRHHRHLQGVGATSKTSRSAGSTSRPASAPSIVLVRRGRMLPPSPSTNHKQGMPLPAQAGERRAAAAEPVREMAGTSQGVPVRLRGRWWRSTTPRRRPAGGKLPVIDARRIADAGHHRAGAAAVDQLPSAGSRLWGGRRAARSRVAAARCRPQRKRQARQRPQMPRLPDQRRRSRHRRAARAAPGAAQNHAADFASDFG